jgi:hypothetical protein
MEEATILCWFLEDSASLELDLCKIANCGVTVSRLSAAEASPSSNMGWRALVAPAVLVHQAWTRTVHSFDRSTRLGPAPLEKVIVV